MNYDELERAGRFINAAVALINDELDKMSKEEFISDRADILRNILSKISTASYSIHKVSIESNTIHEVKDTHLENNAIKVIVKSDSVVIEVAGKGDVSNEEA